MRHAGVLENEFRVLVKPPANLVVHLAHAKARRIRRHEEERGALRDGGVRVGSAVDEEELGHASVGDVALAPVQHPLVALAHRLELPARPGIVRGHAVVRTRRLLGSALSEKIGVVFQERFQEPVLSDHPVQAAAIRWLHFQHWLKVFDIALSPRAISSITSAWGDEINPVSAAFLGHDGGAETEREPFLMILPVESLARVGNHVPARVIWERLPRSRISRLIAPRLLFFVQIKIHTNQPSSMKGWRAFSARPYFTKSAEY